VYYTRVTPTHEAWPTRFGYVLIMADLPHCSLGSSDLEVSLFSLGSWRTYERLSREAGLAVMRAARDAGITFLDDARYNDETGTAPIATGYSEIVFGELFRASGWVRDEVVVANKLWWEFWPHEDAATELDGSLGRMQFDHIDLIYSMPPTKGLAIPDLVEQVAGLISSGRARAWGIGNWPAADLAPAVAAARDLRAPLPVAAQLPYSVVRPDWVEDPAMEAVLDDAGIGLVASYVLAGGVLTGKYARGETGRATVGRGAGAEAPAAGPQEQRLGELAQEWGVASSELAFSFALAHPRLASVLFGATSPEQVRRNVASLDVFESLTGEQIEALRRVAVD
jgi:aryl-alcohol dehydrogenase-like predicted oxidoreductase